MAFMGRGFTSGGQESRSVFSVAVCKIQASKCYIESLPLVPKDNRSCFSQGERSAVQQPLDCVCPLDIWKPSILYQYLGMSRSQPYLEDLWSILLQLVTIVYRWSTCRAPGHFLLSFGGGSLQQKYIASFPGLLSQLTQCCISCEAWEQARSLTASISFPNL